MNRVTVYWCTTDKTPRKEDVTGCKDLKVIVNILKSMDNVNNESVCFVSVRDEYSKDLDKTFVWKTVTHINSTEETLVAWYHGEPDFETTLEYLEDKGISITAKADYGFNEWI